MQSSPQPQPKTCALGEVDRGLGVLNHGLEHHRYVAGEAYGVAHVARLGPMWRHQGIGATLDKSPSVFGWYNELCAAPTVVSAIQKTQALAQ
jgi:GST-like protein